MRPDHLPDFGKPPLDEVVLGVQFSPPQGYKQILAGDVWALFRPDFPHVEELPPLPPSFETFGLPQPSALGVSVLSGVPHGRYWFLSPLKEELIQFQQDRLLHNWRKVGDGTNPYPRFESMVVKFEAELKVLERYFSSLAPQPLKISQCEISYINNIFTGDEGAFPRSDNWLRFATFGDPEPDDFKLVFRDVIVNADGKPVGRLACEAGTAIDRRSRRVLLFSLTVRGAPIGGDITSAIELLKAGRETIVVRFAELTTDQAHKAWERIK